MPTRPPHSRSILPWRPPALLASGLLIATTCPPPAAAAPVRSVLVLSVSESGRQQDRLRGEVSDLVKRAGARLIEAPGVQRSCEEPGCLSAIAREYRVELILAAHIERRTSHDRLIEMWIYEAQSGRDQSAHDFCDSRALADCLTGLAAKLLGPQLSDSPPPAAAPLPPAAAPPLAGQNPGAALPDYRPRRLPAWRIALGIGLGTLAVGALATAITASAKNGQLADASCNFDTCQKYNIGAAYIAPAYVAAGLTALGATFSLAWPPTRPSQTEPRP